MKTKIVSMGCLWLFVSLTSIHAQTKFGNSKLTTRNPTSNVNLPNSSSESPICKPMDIRRTELVLEERVGNSLKIRMDRTDGFVDILGRKQGFSFSEFTYDKPGHNWKYFIQDMTSIDVNTSYGSKHYYLTVLFESDRAEIKGRCPGCLDRFEDSRAPDIQWRNPKIKVKLKPVAYSGSFTFEIAEVEVEGKFETNGAIKAALPSIIIHFKRQIKKAVESQIKMVLNSSNVKRILADVFRGEVHNIGLTSVRMVDLSKSNIYLCQ